MKKLFISILTIAVCSIITAQQFEKESTDKIIGLYHSHISWSDFDNDGDSDFLITGRNDDERLSIIYENRINEGLWFEERTDLTLKGLCASWSDWGDFDEDGDEDIIMIGLADTYYAIVYENRVNLGQGFIERTDIDLPGVRYGQVEWIDTDNDGDLDIMITGQKSDDSYINENYVNYDGVFGQWWYFTGLDGKGSWSDYDNDGDLDMFATYNYTWDYLIGFERYLPGDDSLPARYDIYTSGTQDGIVTWGDYDNDGDDDVVVTTGLWDDVDLDYLDIYENQVDEENGFILNESDIPVLLGAKADWGDYDNDNDLDLIVTGKDESELWAIYLFENQNGDFIDNSSYFTERMMIGYPSWSDINNDNYLDIVVTGYNTETDEYETAFYINNTSTGGGFTKYISSGLPDINVAFGAAAWGDFDNDGDLDPFITGNEENLGKIAILYQNNSNAALNFSKFDESLLEITFGDAAWGDYDNDNDIDLLISGYNYDGVPATKLYENRVNTTGNFVQYTGFAFKNLRSSRIDWGDYDNDGDLDILISGADAEDFYRVYLYENQLNEGNTFVQHKDYFDFFYFAGGEARWTDFNKDGYLDILISENWNGYFYLYLNEIKDSNKFIHYTDYEFPGFYYNSFDIGDIDNDSDQDFIIFGFNYDDAEYNTVIYKNKINEGLAFEPLSGLSLPGVKNGSVKFGDYDNDGDLDFILSGDYETGDTTYLTKLFENRLSQSQGFVEVTGEPFIKLSNSNTNWVDYDGDGDLDISMTGEDIDYYNLTFFYTNSNSVPNDVPTQPSGLSSQIQNNEITLSWQSATDSETPQNGLTYNIRVGETSGGVEIVSPHSEDNGFRLVNSFGNVQSNKIALLRHLPYGNYYWSVQAVDNNFAGGPFSAESTFTLSPLAQFESSVDELCVFDTLTIKFTGYCYNMSTTNFIWNFAGGDTITDTNEVIYVTWNTPGTKNVTLSFNDGIASNNFSHEIVVNPLPEFSIGDTLTPCEGEEITLEPSGLGVGTFTYLWSNSATTSSISVTETNTYQLTVTDNNNCVYSDSVKVNFAGPYQDAEICVVTVDSGKNLIVWEREADKGIVSYNIYKEVTGTDNYLFIGNVPIDELSVFVDTGSHPEVVADRYKISIIDTCGNESEKSEYHQTLHLTINPTIDTGITLRWDHYEGIDFSSYTIYRGTSADNITPILTLPSTRISYTDNPPDGFYYYQVAILLPEICTPTEWAKASSGPFSQSVSNMETKLKSTEDTTSIINYSNVNIKIYPIPATNELNIEFNELNYDLVEIINLNGEVIFMTKEYSDKLSINTSYIPDGMYILRIYHSEGIISRKIAINKH